MNLVRQALALPQDSSLTPGTTGLLYQPQVLERERHLRLDGETGTDCAPGQAPPTRSDREQPNPRASGGDQGSRKADLMSRLLHTVRSRAGKSLTRNIRGDLLSAPVRAEASNLSKLVPSGQSPPDQGAQASRATEPLDESSPVRSGTCHSTTPTIAELAR